MKLEFFFEPLLPKTIEANKVINHFYINLFTRVTNGSWHICPQNFDIWPCLGYPCIDKQAIWLEWILLSLPQFMFVQAKDFCLIEPSQYPWRYGTLKSCKWFGMPPTHFPRNISYWTQIKTSYLFKTEVQLEVMKKN